MKLRNHPVLIALTIVGAILWGAYRALRAIARALWAWNRRRAARCRACKGTGLVYYRGRSISGYRPCTTCYMKGVTL
jgi:hypothetical protein